MVIKDIIIDNYKSIGNKRNKLQTDEHVTALIGKNESGKSNILEAIGEQQNDDTIIHMSKDNLRKIKGRLKDVIENDINFNNELQFIEDVIKNNDMKLDSSNIVTYKKYIESLKRMSTKLDINYNTNINNLLNVAKNKSFDKKEEYMQKLINIKKQITMYFEMLPIIYWRKQDRFLKAMYTLTEIKEIIKNKNQPFYNLIQQSSYEAHENYLQKVSESCGVHIGYVFESVELGKNLVTEKISTTASDRKNIKLMKVILSE